MDALPVHTTMIDIAATVGCVRRRALAVLIAAALATGTALGQAKSRIVWDASDESSTARIEHGLWQEILGRYLRVRESGANLFDYAGLKSSAKDTEKLAAYVDSLQGLDPRNFSKAEQKAYWINLYNAVTVNVVLDAYPVDSIRDIRKNWLIGLFFRGPWDDIHAEVAGEGLSLNTIESGILRPIWRDGRIHYALNCASLGCPDLLPEAFTAENTEAQLEAGARGYVNDARGVDFVDDDLVVVSSIYTWYQEDFGGSEEAVLEHLVRYADEALAKRLGAFEGSISYAYDWSLNEP